MTTTPDEDDDPFAEAECEECGCGCREIECCCVDEDCGECSPQCAYALRDDEGDDDA